jgi:large subunit ribosomal protein L10
MEGPRPEKVAVVEEVRERLTSSGAAILTEYRGLSVPQMAALRRSLRGAGGSYKIYKNSLARFAVRDAGLDELVPLLQGPTGIAFVEGDVVDVARALRDFARANPSLVVKGGLLGDSLLSAADAGALADLPSRDVMLARFAGLLAAPMQRFASLLQALPQNLAYGLKALIDERSAGAPAGEAAPEAEPDGGAAEEVSAEPSPAEQETPVEAATEPAPEAGGEGSDDA